MNDCKCEPGAIDPKCEQHRCRCWPDMGYEPDERAFRETPGPHHTPIRCCLYARMAPPVPPASDEDDAFVYEVVGDRL